MKNLLFLSLLFVPSGSVLLWSNPSWETMQVGKYETIPQWLVGLFTTTNVTQGVLGFLVTYHYLIQGKYFRAAMQTVYAYLGFFFILANGWDNKGYQRFFSRNREAFRRLELGQRRPLAHLRRGEDPPHLRRRFPAPDVLLDNQVAGGRLP